MAALDIVIRYDFVDALFNTTGGSGGRLSFKFAFACHSFSFGFTCRELYCLKLSNLFYFHMS
jgi:hypothetical protein